MVVSFCQTKGHVHVLYKCQDFNVVVLKPLAEWPFLSTRGPSIMEFPPDNSCSKNSFLQSKAVQQNISVVRDPAGGAVLPCVSANFLSRERVSYLPYVTLLLFFPIYILFPSVHIIALKYDHCKKHVFI